jgi:serine/threonine-protein kinase
MSLAQGMSDLYEIFERALAESRGGRAAFLAEACGDRAVLRARIERLLVLAETSDGFLDRSPLNPPLSADVSDDAYEAGHRIGAYRLLRCLGAGGMAEVWLAERTEGGCQQRAAVKIIRDSQGSVSEHFATEREILASLVHPGIARLYDGGVGADGSAYMIMEYVEGEHFITYCNTRRSALNERLALFLQICDAVAYAHTHLVIHRDLKPANILVTAEGAVKLLDFGIAKVLSQESAKEVTRTVHMSPAYAAPEQFAGGYVGTATDVYALGVILFELLTDTLPWSGDASSLTIAVKRLLDAKAPQPSRVATAKSPVPSRAIEGDLDAIVTMALSREPAARYPDARALADEIRRHLDHKPVQARIGARI